MERLLVHQARLGDREGFDYVAAYLVERPDSVRSELESAGVRCRQLSRGSSIDPRWTRALTSLVREEGIDVVHAHSPMPAAVARPVLRAQRHGPRLVYTEHNTWDCYGLPTRVANAATYPLDHHQFAVSADARGSVPRRMRRDVEVLTHGIDLAEVRSHRNARSSTRRSLGLAPSDVVIVNVAHLRAEKAQDVLLDAAAVVLRHHPTAVFLSVGHGPRDVQLLEQHRELGLGDRFRFLGFRTDVADLLAASDAFCLASRQEGLPLAFMEASAMGVPTVATRVGGLIDHVRDGEDGLLVPAGDAPALAAALDRIVADGELRERLGAAASVHAEVFDAAVAIARQEDVYRSLCSGEATAALGPR